MSNIFEPKRLRDSRIVMVLKFDRPIPIIDEALGARSLLVSPTKERQNEREIRSDRR